MLIMRLSGQQRARDAAFAAVRRSPLARVQCRTLRCGDEVGGELGKVRKRLLRSSGGGRCSADVRATLRAGASELSGFPPRDPSLADGWRGLRAVRVQVSVHRY